MENVAFRGFSAVTPENTLTAFRRAAEAGCQRIASELRLSSDGRLFCFADPSLHRVTGTHGWFHRLDAGELGLRPVPFGGNVFRVEKITPLEDLLSLAEERQLGLLLLIPSGTSPRWRGLAEPTVSAVLEVLRPWNDRIDLMLAASDRRVLQFLLDRSAWPVGGIVHRYIDGLQLLEDRRIAFLVADRQLLVPPQRRRRPDDFLQGGLDILAECRRLDRGFYLGPVRKRAELHRFSHLELAGLLTPHTAQLEALRQSWD